MKKLLYLPLLYPGGASEQQYLERALRKQFDVRVFDFYNYRGHKGDEFLRLVQQFRPDIIHAQFQGTKEFDPYLLQLVKMTYPGTTITQWTGDVRQNVIQQFVEYGTYCDLNLVCSKTGVEEYTDAGLKNVRYWQNAVAIPEQIGKPSTTPVGIVFCGGRYTTFPGSQTRINLIESFQREFLHCLTVYGFGWKEHNPVLPWEDQTETYEKAYLTLGQNNIEDLEWWFSDRQLIAMAAGRPHLCQYSKNLEKVFTDMVDCVFWRTVPEAVAKAKWLLDHPKEAAIIGKQGQRKVKKYHSWAIRVSEYAKLVEELQ